MRGIPTALKEKLANRFKVENTDSMAKLRVIATQTSINSLLSEPIHEDIAPAFGDVAVRQTAGESDLSLAYAICLDDGVAKIYKRKFPAGLEYLWEYQWTLGAATDVAIEFNGMWKMNAEKEWYYLQTEEYPYVFYIRDGNLYVQVWRDSDNVSLLATGVSQISACKGWQSSVEPDLDQGLIIGYLKDGEVFYRSLCMQEDGTRVWESERQVAELGDGNTYLSVVRTNDFRAGFMTEKDGQINLILTYRNYAGMSVRPETVVLQTSAAFYICEKLEHYTFENETATVSSVYGYLNFLPTGLIPSISIVSAEKINREDSFYCYGAKLTFDHPLLAELPESYAEEVVVTCSAASVTVTEASITDNGCAIRLLFSGDIKRTYPFTVTLSETHALCYEAYMGEKWYFPGATAEFEMEATNIRICDSETLTMNLSGDVRLIEIGEHYGYTTNSMELTLTAGVTLSPVSTEPI